MTASHLSTDALRDRRKPFLHTPEFLRLATVAFEKTVARETYSEAAKERTHFAEKILKIVATDQELTEAHLREAAEMRGRVLAAFDVMSVVERQSESTVNDVLKAVKAMTRATFDDAIGPAAAELTRALGPCAAPSEVDQLACFHKGHGLAWQWHRDVAGKFAATAVLGVHTTDGVYLRAEDARAGLKTHRLYVACDDRVRDAIMRLDSRWRVCRDVASCIVSGGQFCQDRLTTYDVAMAAVLCVASA